MLGCTVLLGEDSVRYRAYDPNRRVGQHEDSGIYRRYPQSFGCLTLYGCAPSSK